MRLTVLRKQDSWQLSEMEEVHVNLLRMAAEDASMTDCEEGRERMLPLPISQELVEEEQDFLEDWKEYVQEEMETQFAQDVGTMLADLDAVQLHHSAGEDPLEPLYLVQVPLEHARCWFSTLNQARLMLDAKYQLHPDGEHLQLEFMDNAEEGNDFHERLAAYMRYEFYALIQEWLVQQVMDADSHAEDESEESENVDDDNDLI